MAKPPSQFRQMLERSVKSLQRQTAAAVAMDPTSRYPPHLIYSFSSAKPPIEPIYNIATGSDIDIGGLSTCELTPVPATASTSVLSSLPSSSSTTDPSPSSPNSASASSSSASSDAGTSQEGCGQSHLAFHGNMSLKFPPAVQGRLGGAYAAFRNKTRKMLFGEELWDLQGYTHLRIVVGYRGWDGWRSRWSCNVQTDSLVKTDLWQHRLDIPPSPSSAPSPAALDPLRGPAPTLTTLHLPLSAFVLTNAGETADDQVPIDVTKIRTIGFGLLGAGRGADGMPLLGDRRPVAGTEAGSGQGQRQRHGARGGDMDAARVATEEEERLLMSADGWKEFARDEAGYVYGARPEHVREAPSAASKYHRVSSSPAAAAQPVPAAEVETLVQDSAQVRPDSEGYFELCLQSVEAIKWDPAQDDLEDLD